MAGGHGVDKPDLGGHPNRQVGHGSSVWGMWHGGHSYGAPSIEDAEEFESLDAARGAFEHRASGRDRYYPTVSGSTMDIYLGGHPETYRDPYPDKRFTQGENDEAVEEF